MKIIFIFAVKLKTSSTYNRNFCKINYENLIENLKTSFPNKHFYVYLDCDFNDHIIVRFHQLWENEEPYYDVKDFPNIEVFKI